MVDLSIYPHRLQVLELEESYLDSNGRWVSTEGEWVEWCECRLDSRSPRSARIGDGEQKPSSATIYAPAYIDSTENCKIRVYDKDRLIYEGIVTNHRGTRLHTTITAE